METRFILKYKGKKLSAFHPNSNGYGKFLNCILEFSENSFLIFNDINEADKMILNWRKQLEEIKIDEANAKNIEKCQHALTHVKLFKY